MKAHRRYVAAAEKWEWPIIEAVIHASDLLAPEDGEGSSISIDIGAAIKRCKAAWGEIEMFAQSADPENDLENMVGFAFFAGVLYAKRSGGQHE